MSGRIIVALILMSALIAGGALYYLQIYGFYEDVSADVTEIRLMPAAGDTPRVIPASDIDAIDADSSPIRFRACFTTSASLEDLRENHVALDGMIPRNAPEWFDCFDAAAIGAALETGAAQAFLSEKNVHFGVDRIVAITGQGRGYIWHELNDCGEKAYDGTIIGEECPPLPERAQ